MPPTPMPPAVRRLRGARESDIAATPPAPEAHGEPVMPLGLSARARTVWARTVKAMDAAGVLVTADSDTLAAYCECVARWGKANSEVNRKGLFETVEKADGSGSYERLNRALSTVQGETDRMRLLATELGLTPAGRQRLRGMGNAAEKVDPFGSYLSNRGRRVAG